MVDEQTAASEENRSPGLMKYGVISIVLLHVLLGSMVSMANRGLGRSDLMPYHMMVIAAQSNLLGIWGGLGNTHCGLRLPLVIIGVVGIVVELAQGSGGFEVTMFWFVLTATGVVMMVSLPMRLLVVSVHKPIHTDYREGISFSIRHLIIITTLVAAALALSRIEYGSAVGFRGPLGLLLLSLLIGVIGLFTLWATLGKGIPIVRASLAVGLAYCVGALLPINASKGFMVTMLVGQVLVVLTTLLIVRFLGYRLVRRDDD